MHLYTATVKAPLQLFSALQLKYDVYFIYPIQPRQQLDVALKYVQEELTTPKIVIFTDSRAALSRLQRSQVDCPIVRSITDSANKILSRGVSLVAQWIPSHVGIAGNEEADRLASTCTHNDCACPEILCKLDDARLLIRRHLLKQHPDQRVANGTFPPRVRG